MIKVSKFEVSTIFSNIESIYLHDQKILGLIEFEYDAENHNLTVYLLLEEVHGSICAVDFIGEYLDNDLTPRYSNIFNYKYLTRLNESYFLFYKIRQGSI